MPKPLDPHHRYMPGLDGLRALAVLGVIAYHFNTSWLPGGLLGVDVFFVLSGYLITDLLIGQWHRDGRIDLRNFWARRARRLLPALLLLLAGVSLWVLVDRQALWTGFTGDLLAALGYVSNWWYIYHHVSYFARFGPPSPLTHLWSLAVEEQFYLVWPLLVTLGLHKLRSPRSLAWAILGLGLLSAAWMAWLYLPGADPSRVYYGTDTRAFALLLGAALACLWPSRDLTAEVQRTTRWFLELLGGFSLIGMLVMFIVTNEYQTFLYRGGMLLLSILTVGLIMSLVHPATTMGRLLGWGPLRWLGARSYGLYLWHYPVIALTTPTVATAGPSLVRIICQIAAMLLLTLLSWHLVEVPIRQRGWRPLIARRPSALARTALRARWVIVGGTALTVASLGISARHPASALATAPTLSISPALRSSAKQPPLSPSQTADPTLAASTASSAPSTAPSTSPAAVRPPATAIGDSVMVDAEPYLKKALPGIVVSAEVGRQWSQIPQVITLLRKAHQLGPTVVIETGTNGPFTPAELIGVLQGLGPGHRIVLVNTRVPRPWQDVVNANLATVAAEVPGATVVNWYAASRQHNNWFYSDGVHLDPTGASAYANLLIAAVRATNSTTPGS